MIEAAACDHAGGRVAFAFESARRTLIDQLGPAVSKASLEHTPAVAAAAPSSITARHAKSRPRTRRPSAT